MSSQVYAGSPTGLESDSETANVHWVRTAEELEKQFIILKVPAPQTPVLMFGGALGLILIGLILIRKKNKK